MELRFIAFDKFAFEGVENDWIAFRKDSILSPFCELKSILNHALGECSNRPTFAKAHGDWDALPLATAAAAPAAEIVPYAHRDRFDILREKETEKDTDRNHELRLKA
jgi:hypothetical protein